MKVALHTLDHMVYFRKSSARQKLTRSSSRGTKSLIRDQTGRKSPPNKFVFSIKFINLNMVPKSMKYTLRCKTIIHLHPSKYKH